MSINLLRVNLIAHIKCKFKKIKRKVNFTRSQNSRKFESRMTNEQGEPATTLNGLIIVGHNNFLEPTLIFNPCYISSRWAITIGFLEY